MALDKNKYMPAKQHEEESSPKEDNIINYFSNEPISIYHFSKKYNLPFSKTEKNIIKGRYKGSKINGEWLINEKETFHSIINTKIIMFLGPTPLESLSHSIYNNYFSGKYILIFIVTLILTTWFGTYLSSYIIESRLSNKNYSLNSGFTIPFLCTGWFVLSSIIGNIAVDFM